MSLSAIDAVLGDLDEIIEACTVTPSREGYFAAMYRRVTAAVKQAIVDGAFEDGDRMAHLDAVFATRYVDAWRHQRAGRVPTESWKLAFDAAAQPKPLIVQHLLVGMNAHINLDLGVAAATVAPGSEILALQHDFMAINGVLTALVKGFVHSVGEVSPWFSLFDRLGGVGEDEMIRFSLTVARNEAWSFAQQLAALDPPDWNAAINRRDSVTRAVGNAVLHPGGFLKPILWVVRRAESDDIVAVIDHFRIDHLGIDHVR